MYARSITRMQAQVGVKNRGWKVGDFGKRKKKIIVKKEKHEERNFS